MAIGQLFAGNLVSLTVTILAFLQVITWPIAGFVIIATALLVMLSYVHSRGGEGPTLTSPSSSPATISHPRARTHEPITSENKIWKQSTDVKRSIQSQQTPKVSARVEEPPEPKLGDTTSIPEGDYLSFDVELEKGEQVVAEVSASGEVNAYILSDENLAALDVDQEFWYDAGSEGVRSATLHFTAPDDGEWYLVVENVDSKEITATAKIDVAKPSHPIPLLKADGLDLPDARLEGKL